MKREPKIRWQNPLQGEPETWEVMQQMFVQCCNCGCVHMYFVERIEGNKVIVKSYRDDWLTKQARKRRKK